MKFILFILIYFNLILNCLADNILLIRGLDQVVFRGMDVLGAELRHNGHNVNVSSPILAINDNTNYDVVIGNSQGAVVAMNRKQNISKYKPRLIITIDIPSHPDWKSFNGVKHLNIHGPGWGIVKGAKNKFIFSDHLSLSFNKDMRHIVHNAINVW